MTAPLSLLLAFLGLLVSAHARVNAVVAGQPVSVPVLGIIALAAVLLLLVMVLFLARLLVQDGLRSRPKWAAP